MRPAKIRTCVMNGIIYSVAQTKEKGRNKQNKLDKNEKKNF